MPKYGDLTEDTAPDGADLIAIKDASAGTSDRVTLTNLAASSAWSDEYVTIAASATNAAIYLPGTDEDVATPDAADLDIVGDLCAVIEISPADWTPGTSQTLAAKWIGTGNQRSWNIGLRTTGAISFAWSADGIATVATVLSDDTLSALAANERRYVAVTFDADNGASGNTLRFWHSLDGSTWTQLGSDRVTAGASSIYSSTSEVCLGSLSGSSFFIGKLHSFSLRTGIGAAGIVGGTEVAAFDADISGAAKFRDNYGHVWSPTGTEITVSQSADPF